MKVFLGGTCNDSKWRDRLTPELRIHYFNPVVEDWNEEAQQREIQERQDCDFCLYTITPKMIGVYSVAEVIDDSNKRPDKTILVLLREDGRDRFLDAQWKSLSAVAEMVKKNGGQVCFTLVVAAAFLNTPKGSMPGDESECCKRCGSDATLDWLAVGDDLWEQVTDPKDGSGYLCPACFDKLAHERGIRLHWSAEVNEELPINPARVVCACGRSDHTVGVTSSVDETEEE